MLIFNDTILGCVWIGNKRFQEIIFRKIPCVWQLRKIEFLENDFSLTEILLLWPGNGFTLSFYLQIISGSHAKERESERKREREREKERRESREPLLMTDRATRKVELAEIVQSFDRRGRPPRSPRSREAPRRSRSRLRANRDRAKCRSRSRKGPRLSLFLLLSIWLDLIIFFSGFCLCFCIEE